MSKTPVGTTEQDPNAYVTENAEGAEEKAIGRRADGKSPETQGTAGSFYAGDVPIFDQTDEEMVNFNCSPEWHGNSWIVYGRDRSASRLTGALKNARSKSSMIDLVVGRMPWEDEPSKSIVSPNFKGDAARIYISQNANIDKYFELEIVKAGIPNSKHMSAIGIKADAVRIIGRTGIKLTTRTERKTSTMGDGDKISEQGSAGIELIALNDNSNVQPMVLGTNLVDCLKDLKQLIVRTQSQVVKNIQTNINFKRAYNKHAHLTAAPGPPSPPIANPVSAAVAVACIGQEERQKGEIKRIQKRMSNGWEKKWLSPPDGDGRIRQWRADSELSTGPAGPTWGDYILSPHNKNN